MGRIEGLSDELLVKILSFLPTKDAVSTSILSKQWEFLWMWLPKLEYDWTAYEPNPALRDFMDKNLPLHKAPVIESLCIKFGSGSFQPQDIKQWVAIAVSRSLRELSIHYNSRNFEPDVLLPSSLYTSKSLVTLKLEGYMLVDVPRTVSLPSLKTLHLRDVMYLNEDSLRLLLSYCPVLEDLIIQRDGYDDNVKAVVVIVPSLKRLTLLIDGLCSSDVYVIVTPSLKYSKLDDGRENSSFLIDHMSKLEDADIDVTQDLEKLLEPITSLKRLSLRLLCNSVEESVYRAGNAFNQLEYLKLGLETSYWSKLLVRLLSDSPKLRVLNLYVDSDPNFEDYERIIWDKKQSSVPKCLLTSLETFEFVGFRGRPEERDFLSFFFKNVRRLKSSSILC